MFRALLQSLGFAPAQPTSVADWPEIAPAPPLIDLANHAVGPLVFGAPFDAARSALGRPDRFERHDKQTSTLLYAHLGLLLEFDADSGLEHAAFLVAPDRHDPDHPLLARCTPRFSTGATLTARTTEADLRALFGPPKSADRDADETVLVHVQRGLTLECELTPAGMLKRLNVFPTAA